MNKPIDFKELFTFLEALRENNSKIWFDAHRDGYQELRSAYLSWVNQLIDLAAQQDEALLGLEAKNCIFRINRDVRFSANKSPYKTNFSAYLAAGGKKSIGAGYYFHFEPGGSFMAAGIWMPEPALLKNIRQEIDYNWAEVRDLLAAPALSDFQLEGELLSRPPKGYEVENPAIELLKRKSFVLTRAFDPLAKTSTDWLPELAQEVGKLRPFTHFLNRATQQLD